jgi:hypothetical protein
MPKIVPIVEGEGEVQAVPKLLFKILHDLGRFDIQISQPKNANGVSNIWKPMGLEHFLKLAAREADCAAILVLIDSDGKCPITLAKQLCQRAIAAQINQPIMIVCADHMYEAWLVASIESIAGKKLGQREGLPANLQFEGDPDNIPNPKQWLDKRFTKGRGYKETADQVEMTKLLELERSLLLSRSFRRLYHAVEEALEAIDQKIITVTPIFDPKP